MVSQVLEPTTLFQTWCLASTQVYESKRGWSPCLTLYGLEWDVLSGIPSVGAHNLVPDLDVLQAHKCTRYMRERQVQERLVTLSYLVWICMGCVEWYPKCWSPQPCSRLGCLASTQVYKIYERETSPREVGHLVLPCMDLYGMC